MKFEKLVHLAATAGMCAALLGGLAVISSTPGVDDGAGLEQQTNR